MLDVTALADPHCPEDLRVLAAEWPLGFLFNLPPGANIVVAGAHEGKVMDLLARLYPDYWILAGFEPQVDALVRASARLQVLRAVGVGQTDRGIRLFPYALGVHDGEFTMHDWGTREASFVTHRSGEARSSGAVATGRMRAFEHAMVDAGMNAPGIRWIDLLLLNIEGFEFTLLDHLLKMDWFSSGVIRRLAMQVHFGMEGEELYAPSIERLERTHKRVFDELPQWGYWQWSGA